MPKKKGKKNLEQDPDFDDPDVLELGDGQTEEANYNDDQGDEQVEEQPQEEEPPVDPTDAAGVRGFFRVGSKTDGGGQYPTDDPFRPGSTMPHVDPLNGRPPKRLKLKEKIVGKGQIQAEEGMRVWIALGNRGLGVVGEEGAGTIIAVDSSGQECNVKWDMSGQVHTYSCGKYGVCHLSLFDYLERKAWMMYIHETNFKKHNKGKAPRVEKEREQEVMMGYRTDDQLLHRLSYKKRTCSIQ